MKRLFPHPYLSVLLVIVWLLLVNDFRWGSLVFGMILSVVIPVLIAPYWPHRPTISSPLKTLRYVALVMYDIVVANIEVALIVLFKSNRALQPAWVVVPLDLRSPEGISVLSGTITLTPGTVSCDLSECGHALLVHCLHAPDPDSVVRDIKTRYEKRLKEIFI
ncbi:Na+/H+ antiporter subunit E [Paracoccus aerodenitrificans]|uniref:Na+/H+ antiporter subunit E n=1 Tax=Paracoccus aerodenitrificans TaxID=3017781 RepID=UPI0022F01942|nr:Na+/H+ antiporter subunit E [Paracoccus aerodenitrificans]WBU63694.1 Na+/H+ antiporter subunit E [Paracoccus aerodenitrificans]